ncbi:MAG: hypothetical protein OEM42_06440 [Deltaproteobacteria bacterium]|nr:hypothetical protein [Deltaproteobacteria bacterium]MDH3383680.1 hypothetical protein [Deltaproteobacteria bacterium]
MQPPAASGSPLSVHRAFVVMFRAETDAAHGRVAGRIEHVASRQTAPFRSWTEMQAFMELVLIQVQAKPPEVSG